MAHAGNRKEYAMKIMRFITAHDFTTTREHTAAQRRKALQRAFDQSGVKDRDRITISDEARTRFEKGRVIELQQERIRRYVEPWRGLFDEFIEAHDDHLVSIDHLYHQMELKNEIKEGRYDFNNRTVLNDTAESLLALIA